MICICMYVCICISILPVILKKSVENFCFLKLFCFSVKNENTKKPGFYTLLEKKFS